MFMICFPLFEFHLYDLTDILINFLSVLEYYWIIYCFVTLDDIVFEIQ